MNKLFSTIMSVCLACNVQATDLFKTSQDIALRAPSVPLITSDRYLVSLQRTERGKHRTLDSCHTSFAGRSASRRESISFHG